MDFFFIFFFAYFEIYILSLYKFQYMYTFRLSIGFNTEKKNLNLVRETLFGLTFFVWFFHHNRAISQLSKLLSQNVEIRN